MHLTVVPLGGHYYQNAGGRQVPCHVLPTATCAIRWRVMGIHSLVFPLSTIGTRLRLGLDAHSSSSFSAGSQSLPPRLCHWEQRSIAVALQDSSWAS